MKHSEESRQSFTELSIDTADITLQLLSESEIFDQIPIVGLLYKFGKAAYSIPNLLFLKKVEAFIRTVNDKTTEAQREFFAETIKQDEKRLSLLYENLLHKVDSFDDATKPRIYGKIFSCFITNKIREREYDALAHALNSSSLSNLVMFSRGYWQNVMGIRNYRYQCDYSSLVSTGLVVFDIDEVEKKNSLGLPVQFPRFPGPYAKSEVPYEIEFGITQLGKLYVYIAEDIESFFTLQKNENGRYTYEFEDPNKNGDLKKRLEVLIGNEYSH